MCDNRDIHVVRHYSSMKSEAESGFAILHLFYTFLSFIPAMPLVKLGMWLDGHVGLNGGWVEDVGSWTFWLGIFPWIIANIGIHSWLLVRASKIPDDR